MTALGQGMADRLPEPLSGARAPAWWGMLCLVATEGALFVMLLFSYFYIRSLSLAWPPDGIPLPDFTYILPATALLLGSSAPVAWGEWGIRHGKQTPLRLGFALAFAMAAAFMALELFEWSLLGYGPQRDSYASLFFTITGLHLAHVTVALLMNLYILARAWRGHFDALHSLAVENVSLYWHFVDVVWIAVFVALYVSPHVRP